MKSRTTLTALALGAALLGAGAAQAQDTLPTRGTLLPTKNTKEIGVSGFFQFNNDNPYSLALSYGVFTSPKLEFGGIGSVAGAKGTDTATTIGGFVDYYFRGEESVESVTALTPYAGLFAGYASQGSTSNASLGAQVGVKYFFNPNVALTGEVQYRSIRSGNNNTQLVLGLSTFFR